LLGAAAGAFQAQAGDAVQWRVEDGGNGHWYQLRTGQYWWPEARALAQGVGGDLAALETSSERLWCRVRFAGNVLLGGFQQQPASHPNDNWVWVTGLTIDAPLGCDDSPCGCCPGETGDQDFIHFGGGLTDILGDVGVNPQQCADLMPALVEWSADCNADGIVDYGQCHDGTLPDYNENNIPDCCDQGVQCTVGNYPVQWRVEDGGNGHWYAQILSQSAISWHSAQQDATTRGGDLACPSSQASWNWLWKHVIQSSATGWNGWIGLYQDHNAADYSEPWGGWKWRNADPVTFIAWYGTSPDNGHGNCAPEDYCNVMGTYSEVPYWNDLSESGCYCLDGNACARGYTIEWSTDCNSDSIVDYGQILNGTLADTNTNGIPDICEARLIIRVPADQPTIQAAIDAAPLNTQCIVAVSAGTYAGPIDFKGKSVIVRGAGASQTVISGSAGSTLSVVRFTGGEPAFAALENVSIRGGVTGSPFPGSPQFQVGGGLFAYNSAASVRDCVFENNTAAFGGGAYVWNCTGSIQRCAFRNNSAGADGAGIQLYRGSPTVVDTIVENNTANSRGGGLHIVDGTPNLVRTIVRNNISSNNVGGVSWVPAGNAAAFLSIDGCNVTGNTAAVVQGGIGILEDGATTKVSLHGTTVCENLPRPNVAGRFIDLGGNVVCDCAGDLNLDGVVNGADLGLMLSGWGPCGSSCLYDLNVDGVVNGADLGLLLAAWGTCGS